MRICSLAEANDLPNFKVLGIPNSNYVVLTTTNLSGPWKPLSTNTDGSLSDDLAQPMKFRMRLRAVADATEMLNSGRLL